jgi:hypothetical protein
LFTFFSPIFALKAISPLALDLLESAASFKAPQPANFTYNHTSIPLPLAAFLVEVFADFQDPIVVHRINKRFNSDPIFTLLLPIPIPVRFSLGTNTEVLLSLMDSHALPVSRIAPLLETAIQVLSRGAFKTVTFDRVDIEGFDSDRQTLLCKKFNLAFVKGEDSLQSDDSRTFTFWVTPLSGPAFPDGIDVALEREYWPINRRECIECRKKFSDVSNEPCVQSVHDEGCRQLPFEDGSLEKFDPETQQTFVRWSCSTDEIPIDDNGVLILFLDKSADEYLFCSLITKIAMRCGS